MQNDGCTGHLDSNIYYHNVLDVVMTDGDAKSQFWIDWCVGKLANCMTEISNINR